MNKLTVTFKSSSSVRTGPLLVCFPHGVPSSADDMQVVTSCKTDGKRTKNLVSGNLDDLLFEAKDYGETSVRNDACRYAIGVRHDGSKEVSLLRADHAFIMKPLLDFREAPVRNSTLTNYERKLSLTEEFGSRKKKKAVRAAQSNIISSENIAGVGALEMAVSAEVSDATYSINAADEALEKNRKSILPPFNVDASSPEDVYPIDGLLPPHLGEVLEKHFVFIAEKMKDCGADQFSFSSWSEHFSHEGASQLVLDTLEQMKDVFLLKKKKEKNIQRLIPRLYYMHYLISFYNCVASKYDFTVAREDIESAMFSPPAEILDYFSKGTFGNKKNMKTKLFIQSSRAQLDKVLIYTVLLGLSLCGFANFNATMLSKDVKLPETKINQLIRETGCKVHKKVISDSSTSSVSYFVDLEVPLVFPQRKRAKR